jgi:hypothetical protein
MPILISKGAEQMNVAEWIAILSKHDGSEEVLLFDSELGKTRELSSWDIEFKEQNND